MKLKIRTPEWAEPLLADARFKVAFSGRGAGKSDFFASLMIEEHVCNPNMRSLCVRAVQNSINQSVKELIEELIKRYEVEEFFDVQATEIRNTRGDGVILFKGLQSYNSANIKSFQGVDRCWLEEGSDISQTAWDDLEPTIRKEGSQIWVSYNPRYESDPIDKIFRGPKPPKDAIIVETDITKNPWASKANLRSMEYDLSTDIDRYQHVWKGGYHKNTEKRIFKNWRAEEFDTPNGAMFYFGLDFGFSVDPSFLVRCFIDGRKLYVDYEAREIGCETVNLPGLLLTVPESEKWDITADSARPESISHLNRHGFKVRPSVKGANSVVEGIEFLRGYDIIVHPRCKNLIDDLTFYSYKVDKQTNAITPLIDHASSDGCDALRYAVERVRRVAVKKPEPTFTPTPTLKKWN